MKILIILHKAKKKGGAVLQILKMAKAFEEKGHVVSTFSFDSVPTTKNIFLNFGIIVKSLKARIELFKPDIILSSEPIITTLFTIIANRKKITMVVRIGAVYDSFYAARIIERITPNKIYSPLFNCIRIILRKFSKFIFRKISLTVFNSQYLKDIYHKIAPKSLVIHNGIENPQIKNLQINKPVKLVYIGRIEPRKSLELIIRTLNILKLKNIETSLSIIGKTDLYPSYWKKISNLITKYNLSNEVLIHGEIENRKLSSILPNNDILLFSTDESNFPITEGLPNVILEGMCNGLVIIATPVAGIPEIISEENGFLVSAKPEDFAEKIEYLIKQPEVILSIKKHNVDTIVNRFLIQDTARKYLIAFKKLL